MPNEKPQPRTSPIVDMFTGGFDYVVDGISDHHIPFRYENFELDVDLFQMNMSNFNSMQLKVGFTIKGNIEDISKLYEEESWKYRRTESVLKKHPELSAEFRTPAPIFGLMLNKYLQVVSATCKVKGQSPSVVLDQSAELLLLPDSFPPLVDMSEEDTYHYYNKKTTLFYTDLHLNTRYEFEIELEANAATFEFAPFFPYPKVSINKIETEASEYELEPIGIIVQPTRSIKLPSWYEEEMVRHESFGEPRRGRPVFHPAFPYRGEEPLFDITKEVFSVPPKTREEAEEMFKRSFADIDSPITLNNYETIRFGFLVTIPPDKDAEVNVRVIQRPVPVRIYEQMQKLPGYQDVLIKYDIFNFTHGKLRLRVETEILDFTEKQMKVISLHGINNQRDQKARIVMTQCPRLKRGILDQTIKPEKATLHAKVTNEDTKDVLYEETHNIDLLANDEITWELKDVRSNTKYSLHEFVCSWITPRDSEGLIEKIRTEAGLRRPSHAFGDGDLTDFSNIESHVKAVYEHLSEYGLIYVNQPFSGMLNTTGQRIVLPEVVLKNKAGNCIDLTILFASILEGIGVFSLIFLTQDHAFIGWGNKRNPNEILFLETTAIGGATFDEAKTLGRKVFKDDFTMLGLPDHAMPPLDMMGIMRGCHMVDTGEVKFSGRISRRA